MINIQLFFRLGTHNMHAVHPRRDGVGGGGGSGGLGYFHKFRIGVGLPES